MRLRLVVIALAVLVVLVAPASAVGAAVTAPDPSLTPGVTDPAVTQTNIGQTICHRGWSSAHRNVTAKAKTRVFVMYRVAKADRHLYTIDHLISLEVGGRNDPANLWPEPNADAKKKDGIENKLHDAVCARKVTLVFAQLLLSQWNRTTTATTITTTAPTTSTAVPVVPTRSPIATTAPGNEATARCNDGTYSYAVHHAGACSRHGGVAVFYK